MKREHICVAIRIVRIQLGMRIEVEDKRVTSDNTAIANMIRKTNYKVPLTLLSFIGTDGKISGTASRKAR